MTDLGLIWCPVNIMLKPSATLINRPLRPSEYRFRLLSPPKLGEVPEGGRGLFLTYKVYHPPIGQSILTGSLQTPPPFGQCPRVALGSAPLTWTQKRI